MKSKSNTLLLSLLLMATVSFTMPIAGGAAMWIGLQGGANFVANGDVRGDVDFFTSNSPLSLGGLKYNRLKDVKTDTAALGGITIGYDFVNEGFLKYDWPNWMKYFSVAIDFTYNNYSQPAQQVQARMLSNGFPSPFIQFPLRISKADGYIMTLSMLIIAKYGFIPSSEFPFGRLIPYAGVGPGLFFSVVNTPYSFFNSPSSDSVEVGIVTEGGVRYMLTHHISLDAAFRYRYVMPSYDVQYNSNLGEFDVSGRIITSQFSAILRVNYHF